ncbi:hypothetical protein JYK22_18200, partial [Nonomuraea sp. RK-328]|nr:hypothetical protein [Nonomuraea sp. RK-328]
MTDAPQEPVDDEEEPQAPQASPPDAERDTPDDVDDGALRQSASVINNFLGYTDASGSMFGMGERATVRAATRTIEPGEISELLRSYLAPDCFATAEKHLREQHLLSLVGPEGIGKRVGAIALLSRMPLADGRVTVFSPARTLAELARQTRFKPGRAYLVHDWSGDGPDTAVSRFEMAGLSQKLVKTGAYLVLTRTGHWRKDANLAVAWHAPDPGELFDLALGSPRGRTPEDIRWARQRADQLGSPSAIVALADRLARTDTPVADLLSEDEGGEVAAWFDDKPSREDVLLVAALAFAYRAPERIFEQELARLTEIKRLHDAETPGQLERSDEPQTRAVWRSGHPLVTTCVEGAGSASERRLVFRGRCREQVIDELAARYGLSLWAPLREWILTLVETDLEVQIQAAAGVALLARSALREVHDEFLDAWAGGRAAQRLAAANVISLMCADDSLAPEALALTLRWVTGAGQEKAMTAAMALGGGLSVRYPADALNWLWHLTLRGQRISVVARRSLVLLCRQAAERDDQAGEVLRVLVRLAAGERRAGGPSWARTAFDAVVDVLAADRLEGAEPMAGHLLATRPATAGHLGRLWALVLQSSYHRGRAIEALRRVLTALDGAQAVLPAVADFGSVLWSEMPPDHAPLIEMFLRHALVDASPRLGDQLVRAVLSAGAGPATPRRR